MLRKDYSHHIASPEHPKPRRGNHLAFWRDLNIFLILFFFFSFFTFLFLNGNAFWRDLRYALFLNSPFANEDLKSGEILRVTNAADVGDTAGEEGFQQGSSPLLLVIPKISVTVPIIIPSDGSKKAVLSSLEAGVGLFPGSSLPGTTGRAVVLGHSSRASWYRGDYATVFTLISRLEVGDTFYVTTDKKKYVYEVFAHLTLLPKETDALLAGPTSDSEIDLVTCYPIGGASKRTIIQAKLLGVENI